MSRERILRLVRRGRARLEAIRVVREAARGALWGGGAGLAVMVAGKLGAGVPAWLPWALVATGAVAGALVAAFARGIGLGATALFLDERLATQERIVTLLTREPGRFGDRLVRELEGVRRLPRLPFPRELSLVPAALFLLFAVSLLPGWDGTDAAAAEQGPAFAKPRAVRLAEAPPDVSEAIERMQRGEVPPAAKEVEEAIERGLHTPEERAAAREALERALEGQAGAAQELAERLKAAGNAGGPRGASLSAYPEQRELVLAYRRALAEERNTGR